MSVPNHIQRDYDFQIKQLDDIEKRIEKYQKPFSLNTLFTIAGWGLVALAAVAIDYSIVHEVFAYSLSNEFGELSATGAIMAATKALMPFGLVASAHWLYGKLPNWGRVLGVGLIFAPLLLGIPFLFGAMNGANMIPDLSGAGEATSEFLKGLGIPATDPSGVTRTGISALLYDNFVKYLGDDALFMPLVMGGLMTISTLIGGIASHTAFSAWGKASGRANLNSDEQAILDGMLSKRDAIVKKIKKLETEYPELGQRAKQEEEEDRQAGRTPQTGPTAPDSARVANANMRFPVARVA